MQTMIQARRRDLGIAERPPAPKPVGRFVAVPRELTPEEAAERDRRLAEAERIRDLEREQQRKYELRSAWNAVLGARGTRYESAQLDTFAVYDERQRAALDRVRKFCERMPSHFHDGRGLVLFGPCGTGKDHLLVASLRCAVFKHGYKPRWVNGMELFGELRDSIGEDRSERDVLRRYVEADILAISDPLPPFGGLTEYQASMLFRIIDGRYSRMLPTWATVNVRDGKEAVDRMGAQIVDRLRDGAVQVECNWPSYRKPTDE